jgi:hypothetical protein
MQWKVTLTFPTPTDAYRAGFVGRGAAGPHLHRYIYRADAERQLADWRSNYPYARLTMTREGLT